jgi:hypothetical protein
MTDADAIRPAEEMVGLWALQRAAELLGAEALLNKLPYSRQIELSQQLGAELIALRDRTKNWPERL